jgi:hypothetical protein
MPIEPVKIPQNVYIEDRIVGPLTLKQIIISMLGIGFSYAIWASIQKVQGYVPLPITIIVWIPGVLAVIFSFVKINDLSLTHLLFLMVERVQKPQTRIYGPRRGISVNTLSFAAPNPNSRTVVRKDEQPVGDISRLSAFLDQEGVRPMSREHGPEEDDRQYALEEAPAAAEQGSSIPPRPVQKDRVKVSPLQTSEIADLENENGKKLFQDIFHPPASHA